MIAQIASPYRIVLVFCALTIAAVTLAACDQRALVNKAAPKEELEFTQRFVELLQRRDLIEVGVQFDQEALQAMQDDVILALADLVPDGPPVAISLQGVNVKRYASGVRLTGLSLEYEFPSQWLLVEIEVIRKSEGPPMVHAIRVTPLPASLREINAFRLAGKPIEAYLVAGTTLAVIAFVATSIIACVATTRLRWWWRVAWCLAMFTGVGRLLVEWTSGQVELELFNFNFFSTSIGRLGPDGPYYFEAVLPVGAIAFWLWRRSSNVPPRGTAADHVAQFD